MRLINVETKRLENFYGDPSVPYAILSHTWGKEEVELSFQDLQSLDERGTGRMAKLDGTCAQAQRDGLKYAWIDTCCIDKTNAVELSEAITSMFRWYKKSAMCYTYLSDVKEGGASQIRNSRWFTRGWTLQELLASPKITFFDSSWRTIGTKSSLSGVIIEATGIPHHILSGFASLDSASIAQKFHWVSKRTTTRPEDMAYCLFGIFDIAIPPLYGEGLELAFERLQEAIMRKSPDDSILAWDAVIRRDSDSNATLPAVSGGVLANSPAAFLGCGDIIQRGQTDTRIRASETAWGTIPISIRMDTRPHALADGQVALQYGYLSCGPRSDPSLVVAIPLIRCHQDPSNNHGPPVYLRPRGSKAICLPKPASTDVAPVTILIRKDRARDQIRADDKSYWFYLPGPHPYHAGIDDVYPADCYVKEMAMIATPRELKTESQLFLVRFSCTAPRTREHDIAGREPQRVQFILALEFYADSAQGRREPCASLYFDSTPGSAPTPLPEIAEMWPSLSQSWTSHLHLDAEQFAIKVRIGADTIAGHCLWAVGLLQHNPTEVLEIPPVWPNVSEQMMLRKRGIALVQALRDRARLTEQYYALCAEGIRIDQVRKPIEEKRDRMQEEIRELMADVEKLNRKLKDLEQDESNYKKWITDHNIETEKCSFELVDIFFDGQMKRVWSARDDPLPGHPPRPNSDEWVEAARRERNGILAHIMRECPVLIEGKELSWVPGMTLLMYAAATGDRDLVQATLKYDNDIEAKDSVGMTVFDWARLAPKDPSDVITLLTAQTSQNNDGMPRTNEPEENQLTFRDRIAYRGLVGESGGQGSKQTGSAASPAYMYGARPFALSVGGDTGKQPAQQQLGYGNRQSYEASRYLEALQYLDGVSKTIPTHIGQLSQDPGGTDKPEPTDSNPAPPPKSRGPLVKRILRDPKPPPKSIPTRELRAKPIDSTLKPSPIPRIPQLEWEVPEAPEPGLSGKIEKVKRFLQQL